MNREFKFRTFMGDGNGFTFYDLHGRDWYWTCEKDHVEQWTGIKDKNGVEIYEGDIVAWFVNGNDPVYAPVVFCDAAFWMGESMSVNGSKTCGGVWNDWGRGEYEVVGNIHEGLADQ